MMHDASYESNEDRQYGHRRLHNEPTWIEQIKKYNTRTEQTGRNRNKTGKKGKKAARTQNTEEKVDMMQKKPRPRKEERSREASKRTKCESKRYQEEKETD